MKDEILIKEDYINDLNRIKQAIRTNQNKLMVVVNQTMILTYYEIGTIINNRKSWGNKYIQKLANDLKDFKGYSYRNLVRMAKFASEFKKEELLPQAVAQIPWGTLDTIMSKSSTHEEMKWYIKATYENKWSRSMLINQIEMKAYERNKIKPITTERIITSNNELVNTLFKDTYVFDFIDKENIRSERQLKDKMIDNVLSLLNEFGKGFSLVGREYKLITPSNKEFKIDLLLYHTKIHAYIVIEVKIGEFKPEYTGQLNFYVNCIDDLEKEDNDNPTIGLLLCKDVDNYVAETTLKYNQSFIGISKYKLIEDLPSYLTKHLMDK